MTVRVSALCLVATIIFSDLSMSAEAPSKKDAAAALKKAVTFFQTNVGTQGGYLWKYSGDLKLREAEGKVSTTTIWVQPPGTPAVGEAYLAAYEATGDKSYLDAAIETGDALLRGQLRSGGWDHHIELDPKLRLKYAYRDVPPARKQQGQSSLDDDISQSAVRFLAQLDRALGFKEERFHEATLYALDSMLKAQRPSGGWYQWWDRFPTPTTKDEYPVLKASYPKEWSRKWLNDWTGRYYLNDNVMANMIDTLLLANAVYDDPKYLQAAEKAGDFLLLAQMPAPQPAWCQQYDKAMQPVWDRKFEPPAITGRESQDAILALLALHQRTGDKKYLQPIPAALAYLKSSRLPDGRLSRYYELQTNRPLYLKRNGKVYHLTYSADDLPDHYAFIVDSRLDAIEAQYQRQSSAAKADVANEEDLGPQVARIIASMDSRGAWVEKGRLPHHKVEPESGIIDCATFVANVKTLSRYLAQGR